MQRALIVACLNNRLRPTDRGELFQKPLDEFLKRYAIGAVIGGSTQLAENSEVAYGEIEIEVTGAIDDALGVIKTALEQLGAPKGSKLSVPTSRRELAIGTSEGMAVYLNSTDLPAKVYEECDVNVVFEEFNRRLDPIGRIYSYWQGPGETALYMYGTSFALMRAKLADFLATYPLCQRARVEQIA
jgi:hypothetical protein